VTTPNIYGPLVAADEVEEAVQTHFQAWMVAYLAEFERRRGLAPRTLPEPLTWKLTNEPLDRWPGEPVPAIIITSPGFAAEPVVDGDGNYTCVFGIVAGAIVLDNTSQRAARKLAKLYGACLMATLVHHPEVADNMAVLRIVDAQDADLPSDFLPIGAAAEVSFEIVVEGVLQAGAGPTEPPDDPYHDPGNWPTVATTDLTLTAEAIT
jgi:hypothetical protein